MNKKVSTLLTVALTLGGSLLSSSAFAADVTPAKFLAAFSSEDGKNALVLDLSKLDLPEGDSEIALTGNVDLSNLYTLDKHPEGQVGADGEKYRKYSVPLVILKDAVTITSAEGANVTFTGNILAAADGIAIKNITLKTPNNNVPGVGPWYSSLISVFADKVTISGNKFEGQERVGGYNEAIVIYPQSAQNNKYSISGNTFSTFKASRDKVSGAIRFVLNNKAQNNYGWQAGESFKTVYDAIKVLGVNGIADGQNNNKGENSANPDIDLYELLSEDNGNRFGESNNSNVLVFNGDEITKAAFNGTEDVVEGTMGAIFRSLAPSSNLLFANATTEEIQELFTEQDVDERNINTVGFSIREGVNVIGNDGTPDNQYPSITVDGHRYLTSAQLNNINRGSFSLGYEFDSNHKATDNPFNRELKAFYLNDSEVNRKSVFLATSWPASADNKNVLSKEEFNKCEFLVAKATDDENLYWNISGHSEFGESVYFEVVKGDRLLKYWNKEDLKSKKFTYNNAQFAVTKDADGYVFTMSRLVGLNKKGDVDFSDNVTIALVSNGKQRIVTTVLSEGVEDIDGKLCIHASIGNTRTVDAEHFLSTDKASIFNIKFISKKIKNDETKSEYNKYLTINQNGLLAHGSDFTNLNAPESQWIVTAHNDDNTFTFQNRENEYMSFDAELLSTDKDNVFELRSDDKLNYAYVDKADGEYKVFDGKELNGMTVELTAVTPNKEAGYATTELDNAGLVRFVFNRIEEDNVKLSDFYVTANDKNEVEVNKEESEAAQFSIVKFAAPSTATALADSIYADNDYVVWNASDKKVDTVEDGDSIAVVAYAFKQLRADGKNYYLNYDMNSVQKYDDEAQAPRFLVKLYKNGSYGLIPVYNNNWNRGDYFRDIVNEWAYTFTLDNNADIAKSTSVYYDYTVNRKFDFNILKETPGTSYNHVPQHVTMEAVNGGYIAMNSENNNGIIAPVSTLKADYTKEDLTFWLDTTDSEAVTPSFMISKAGNYMYNATDSLNRYNSGTASEEKVKEFALNVNGADLPRVIFQSADLTKVEDIENYKFQIVQSPESEEEYIIKSLNGYNYVAAHNQQLYISTKVDAALRLIVTPAEAPTSNEGVSTTEVKVVANNGSINVKNAAGKNVVVSTILGQVVANEVLTSDNATINVPAGIVVVAVEGESFKVNVK